MKVLVIGLRNEQNKRLEKEFPGVKFTALDAQTLHHKAVNGANLFDKIISVTKFTNKTTHANYRKHPGYCMVAGGYSSVVTLLTTFVSK